MKTSSRLNVGTAAIYGLVASVVALVLIQPWDPAITIGPLSLQPQPEAEYKLLETEAYTRQPVEFDCSGERCHAWLYIPKHHEGALPYVILGHGVGLTKGFGLHQPASFFAEAGFAALAFDYRTWGSSSGKPRQLLSPFHHIEDWHSAITYASSLNASHIILRGVSYSGGQVLDVAATSSKDITAVIAMTPTVDMWDITLWTFRFRPITNKLRQLVAVAQDRMRTWMGLRPLYIPIFGEPGSPAYVGCLPADIDGYLEMVPAEYQGTWQNLMRASHLLHNFLLTPIHKVHKIKCPTLIQAARDDMLLPLSMLEKTAAKIPLGSLEVYPGGHFDVIHNTPQPILDAQVHFLQQHVLPPISTSAV